MVGLNACAVPGLRGAASQLCEDEPGDMDEPAWDHHELMIECGC